MVLLLLEVFTQRNIVANFYSIELDFYSQKQQIRFLSHPLGSQG